MPASLNITLSTAPSEPPREPLSLPGLAWPVELNRHPRARYLRLRLDEPRRLLRLTVPRRVGQRAALDWARRQSAWVDAQLATIEPAQPLCPGATIPFEGANLLLAWAEDAARTPRLDDGQLLCGGPRDRFADRIARWLKGRARDVLGAETHALAAAASIAPGPVSVGDAATRWGSCSASGAIRYNWRLILAPLEVRRYVVAHEVAHRVHMNHGPAFHALQRDLFGGDVAPARLTLRRVGPGLKRVGGRG